MIHIQSTAFCEPGRKPAIGPGPFSSSNLCCIAATHNDVMARANGDGARSTGLAGGCSAWARNPTWRHVEQHQPSQGALYPASGQGGGVCDLVADRELQAMQRGADGSAGEPAAGPDHRAGPHAHALLDLPRPGRGGGHGQPGAGLAGARRAGMGTGKLRISRAVSPGRRISAAVRKVDTLSGMLSMIEHIAMCLASEGPRLLSAPVASLTPKPAS